MGIFRISVDVLRQENQRKWAGAVVFDPGIVGNTDSDHDGIKAGKVEFHIAGIAGIEFALENNGPTANMSVYRCLL